MHVVFVVYEAPITTTIYFPSEHILNYTERWPEHVSAVESLAALIKNCFNPALDNSPQSALQEGNGHLRGEEETLLVFFLGCRNHFKENKLSLNCKFWTCNWIVQQLSYFLLSQAPPAFKQLLITICLARKSSMGHMIPCPSEVGWSYQWYDFRCCAQNECHASLLL